MNHIYKLSIDNSYIVVYTVYMTTKQKLFKALFKKSIRAYCIDLIKTDRQSKKLAEQLNYSDLIEIVDNVVDGAYKVIAKK